MKGRFGICSSINASRAQSSGDLIQFDPYTERINYAIEMESTYNVRYFVGWYSLTVKSHFFRYSW